MLDTAEQEESGPFTDINDDKDEIEENKIVLENSYIAYTAILCLSCALLLCDAVHVCACAT